MTDIHTAVQTDLGQIATPVVVPGTVDVSVIIPTYCEAENLPEIVPQVAQALADAGMVGEIVVVDDNSPDDTETVCNELQGSYPVRLLIRREDRGLSSAVLHGMRQARGSILVVMDADLSHPPEKVPELVRTLKQDGTDFVIGSRYVPGGSTDDSWGLLRWLNSKAATLLAWPLTRAKDPMAGFFAIRRSDVEGAAEFDPIGYKIGLELMVKAGCRDVREVPIHFRDRLHGESKLSLREQLNYLRHLKRLYEFKLGRLARPLQFGLVGATGTVVDLAAFLFLLKLLPLSGARAVAIWTAMTWNFWWNRQVTFSDARRHSVLRQYTFFCTSCLIGGVVNWSVSVGLCAAFAFFDQWKLIAALLGVVAGTVFNYTLSSRVVFKRD